MVQLKKKLKKEINPDFLFLEPSELIVTNELRDVVKMGLRDMRYEIGPIITLIDGPSFDFQWEERPKLVLGQIQGADIVAISRTDLIDAEQIDYIRNNLNIANHNLLLSKNNSSAIDELAREVVSTDQEQ